MIQPRPIAFVVQRYGAEIVGGAESLCRAVAEMLSVERPVEVVTSCAKDYTTWRNEYPAGESVLNGVLVRRFPVDFERDHRFHEVFGEILGGLSLASYHHRKALMRQVIGRSSPELQRAFFVLSGPYSTPLLDYLETHHPDYELVVFFTYLYATTYFGSQRVPAPKAVLVPTAHDEAPIFLPAFREMFAHFPALIFLSPEERCFIEQTFAVGSALRTTAGMPVELSGAPDPGRFRAKYGISGPFLLYAGRIDPSKGCDALFAFFRAARHHLPTDLPLVLIGSRDMPIPRDARIRYLGRLAEQDKLDAMAAATLLVNPSPFESFSIVILEAMLCGTPVLVNGACEVLKGHVLRSSGGLYYSDCYEFVEALRLLLTDDGLRSGMGHNGAEYVGQNYARDVVRDRYHTLFAKAALARAPQRQRDGS
jgi:glycosyltransferase involved in cell wall biosynthesis